MGTVPHCACCIMPWVTLGFFSMFMPPPQKDKMWGLNWNGLAKLIHLYCVGSLNPILIKGFSSNLAQRFSLPSQCLDSMFPLYQSRSKSHLMVKDSAWYESRLIYTEFTCILVWLWRKLLAYRNTRICSCTNQYWARQQWLTPDRVWTHAGSNPSIILVRRVNHSTMRLPQLAVVLA